MDEARVDNFIQITVVCPPEPQVAVLFTGMMERSIRRYGPTSNFPISLENSSWLESMGSLINKGEESRILLGREVSFGWNYQVVPESSSNVHENKFYTLPLIKANELSTNLQSLCIPGVILHLCLAIILNFSPACSVPLPYFADSANNLS